MLLRTLFFHCCAYPWTILVILLGVPFSFISPNYLHNCGIVWARGCLRLAGIRVKVNGAEHIPRDRSAVFIANHQSHFDILALYASLPIQFRWMAKQELFKIPLFGMAMRRSGYIAIDRSDRRKSMQSMIAAAQRIQNGTSVIVFPEGTRSADGRLQSFKKGGFMIAMRAQAPLIPVVINGSYALLPRGRTTIRSGRIDINILPPEETAGLGNKDIDNLMSRMHTLLASHIREGDAA